MEKSTSKDSLQIVTTISDIPAAQEKSSSSASSGKIIENCDKKNSETIAKETDITGTLAQDKCTVKHPTKSNAAAQEEDEEEIVLHLNSSDEETFEDAIEEVAELNVIKTKIPDEGKLEKYFSDIESSDDSQEYEPKCTILDNVEGERKVPDETAAIPVETPGKGSTFEKIIPSDKVAHKIELEFEPVESDEEDFEEPPSLETEDAVAEQKKDLPEVGALSEVANEDLPEDRQLSEVEDVTNEEEESQLRSTPLFDEEDSISDEKDEVVQDKKNAVSSLTPSQVAVDGGECVSASPALLEEEKSEKNESEKEENELPVDVTKESLVDETLTSVLAEKEKEDKASSSSSTEVSGSPTNAEVEPYKLAMKEEVQEAMEVDNEIASFEEKDPVDSIEKERVPEIAGIEKKVQENYDSSTKYIDGEKDELPGETVSIESAENQATPQLVTEILKAPTQTEKSLKIAEQSEDNRDYPTGDEKSLEKEKKYPDVEEILLEKCHISDKSSKDLSKHEESQKIVEGSKMNMEQHPIGNDESLGNQKSTVETLMTTDNILQDLTDDENSMMTPDGSDKFKKFCESPSEAAGSLKTAEKFKKSLKESTEADTLQEKPKEKDEIVEVSIGDEEFPVTVENSDEITTDATEKEKCVAKTKENVNDEMVAEKSDEFTEDATEKEKSLEKLKESAKDPIENETSQKKLEEKPLEESEKSTNYTAECEESLEKENKLLEKPSKLPTQEISQESKEKSVDILVKDNANTEETNAKSSPVLMDKTATNIVLQKMLDELRLADIKGDSVGVKTGQSSKAESDPKTPSKTSLSKSELIEIDDEDVKHDVNEMKQGERQTNVGETAAPTGKNVDNVANEAASQDKLGQQLNQTVEDNPPDSIKPESEEEKQKEKESSVIQAQTVTLEKSSQKLDAAINVKEDETVIVKESVENTTKAEVEMLETTETRECLPDVGAPKEEQSIKDDTMMKAADSASAQGPAIEDEEPLLMIDTAHKEENENEDNDMDTETEQTATSAPTSDSSSDGSLEVFYDKECINYECKHGSKNFYRATLFSLNYYKISKKRSKVQFACEECYDRALDSYEEMCRTLKQKQPLLHGPTFKGQEYVEIIDSSDEEESDGAAEKFKDENTLPKESIEMLEAELEGAIRKVMHNVEIQNQLSWTKQILQQRLNNLEEDTEFVSEQLRLLQKKADNMHNSLYQCPKIKIRQLTPLDLNSGRSYNPETESTIPPIGEVLRTNIHLNETYYAVKNKAIASWVPCKVIEAIECYVPAAKSVKHYKIKFLKSKYPMLKTVSAKHMAFFNPPKVRLPIGTRVIAYFDATSLSRGKEKMLIPSAFYPGIIAEPLKQSNKFRYLVFYDDGYFQYVYHKDVRLVCHASEHVWEDVHHQSREFIHNYLTQYAVNRPMVQTQKGQSMLVDYNGKWIYARVIDVDCSLVQMLFEGQSRSEWIYRGSTRLGPVYKESNNLVQKNQWGTSRISRRTEPFIRYFNGDDSSSSQQPHESQQPKPGEVRSVAKKSVSRTDTSQSSQPVPTVRHLNNSTIFVDDDNKPKGKVVYYTARKNLPPRDYVQHICNPSCPFTITHNLLYYSPLAKPLLSGWERQVFRQKSKKFIVYRGPCGKRMRSMEELHRYLRVTENELNVDNFDFSPETNCLAEYVIESCIVQKKDISNGKEKMPIPCVNYYDNTMPPDCIYSSRRIPTEGVPLNLDREFLVGCDCEDDCSDKAKCSCWELTYAGAKYGMPNVPNEMVGYQYKRLYEHVPTGIYECNSRCKCKANCVNRVVQQPLQSKLQVFKTSNRGWGLRCINDVPRGSFICVYAGHLLTEQKANEGGLDAGDEYFAELDYIEVAEQIKEGYESDVVEPDEDEELYNPEKEDEDDDEFVAPSESHLNKAFNTRLRTRRSTKNSTDAEHDSQERQVISFEPKRTMGQPDNSTSEKPTIRKLFGKDEACYIMDAKITGNLGRYFNHSCSPNLFVQNVFVDTHDLRFPWVAFFAFTHIRAGTELTWNYNYEVGVVPGKVLYCQCGAPNCRQRLL